MPVRDFASDVNGNMAVVGGDFVLSGSTPDMAGAVATAADQAAIAQAIQIALLLLLGEYYLDESEGTDLLGTVLVKSPDAPVIRAHLVSRIMTVAGVTSVEGAQLVVNADRTATINFTVFTLYSTTPLQGSVTA